MIVSDVWYDARDIFGNCNPDVLLARISDAIELLSAKASPGWDANLAEMSLCTCESYVTLPYDVGTPLAVSANGVPSIARDKWYIYHINGTGPKGWVPAGFWDDAGERPIIREIKVPSKLLVTLQFATDQNKAFWVYGTDINGTPLITLNQDGTTTPGINLLQNYNPAVATDVYVKWIDRIVREPTNGFVKLWAVDTVDNLGTLLGHYEPQETQPMYRRVRFPCKSQIRMRYRRKTLRVSGLNDFIPLDSRFALQMMMQAVFYYRNKNFAEAAPFEIKAVQFAQEEQKARNAISGIGMQVNVCDGAQNASLYGYPASDTVGYPGGYGPYYGGSGYGG